MLIVKNFNHAKFWSRTIFILQINTFLIVHGGCGSDAISAVLLKIISDPVPSGPNTNQTEKDGRPLTINKWF